MTEGDDVFIYSDKGPCLKCKKLTTHKTQVCLECRKSKCKRCKKDVSRQKIVFGYTSDYCEECKRATGAATDEKKYSAAMFNGDM